MAEKFTPGPWTHRKSPVECGDVRCVYFSTKRDEPYATSALLPADARLIAAAPDLYAACEKAEVLLTKQLNEHNDALAIIPTNLPYYVPGPTLTAIRKALAKARGE
jgi:hypothetical protein